MGRGVSLNFRLRMCVCVCEYMSYVFCTALCDPAQEFELRLECVGALGNTEET